MNVLRSQKLKTWDFASKFVLKKTKIDVMYSRPKFKERYDQEYTELGKWTKEQLIDLGPTFIKLGQIASSRQDIFNDFFVQELVYLQDDCPEIENHDIVGLVEKEIGAPIDSVFRSFDTDPYKAASIGQVHNAVMKNGLDVVVKVQRPGIEEVILRDLSNIREIFQIFELFQITKSYDNSLLNDSEKYLMEEIDYIKEANNARAFRKNFYGTKCVVPRVCDKYSTKKVLVMERVNGTKITEVDDAEKKKAVKFIIKAFLKQLVDDGLIHGDPHPGNMAFDGRLILYDFGLVIDVSSLVKNSFDDIILCLIQRDSKKLTELLIGSKLIIPSSNKANIVFFFDSIFQMINAPTGYDEQMFDESVETLNELGFSDTNRPFTISNDLIYIGKSLTLLDGICRKLDPDYKPLKFIKPYIEKKIDSPVSLDGILTNIVELPSKIKNMNTSIIEIEKTTYSTRNRTKMIKRDLRQTQYLVATLCAYIIFHF